MNKGLYERVTGIEPVLTAWKAEKLIFGRFLYVYI